MRELPLSLQKQSRLAVVSGLQTQHREPLRPQPEVGYHAGLKSDILLHKGIQLELLKSEGVKNWLKVARYQVGDKLWLQEPYQINRYIWPDVVGKYSDSGESFSVQLTYEEYEQWKDRKCPFGKTAGRFIYKSLARHWFEVTDVRAEQVHDITIEDIWAEGRSPSISDDEDYSAGYEWFADLWDSCYGVGAWDRNEWVWAYTFRKVERV